MALVPKKISECVAELEQQSAESARLRGELAKREERIARLESDTEVNQLRSKVRILVDRAEQAEKQADDYRTENTILRQQESVADSEIERLREELATLRQQLEAAGKVRWEDLPKASEYPNGFGPLDVRMLDDGMYIVKLGEISGLRGNLIRAEHETKRLLDDLTLLGKERDKANATLAERERELKEAREAAAKAKDRAAEAEEGYSERYELIQVVTRQRDAARHEVEKLTDTLERANGFYVARGLEIDRLTAELDTARRELAEAKAELDQARESNRGLLEHAREDTRAIDELKSELDRCAAGPIPQGGCPPKSGLYFQERLWDGLAWNNIIAPRWMPLPCERPAPAAQSHAPTGSDAENAALDKCVKCTEGILSSKLGGMCGDCDPFAPTGSEDCAEASEAIADGRTVCHQAIDQVWDALAEAVEGKS